MSAALRARRTDLVISRWQARFLGRIFPCAVGRSGIIAASAKREGDGATPAGRYRILSVFGRHDRAKMPEGAILSPLKLVWCDDPSDPRYNQGMLAASAAGHPERLRRSDPLYDLVAVIDHNWPDPQPGYGSAIFLHCWRKPRHPTAGCVAFARVDLDWILRRWSPSSRVVIGAV
ncbi:MAG: L,D-transpeptidase family protein [Pseudomonadota bacterium]